MKYMVDLWLDGYEDDEEREAAGIVFIQESLDFSASSVRVESWPPEDAALTYKGDAGETKLSARDTLLTDFLDKVRAGVDVAIAAWAHRDEIYACCERIAKNAVLTYLDDGYGQTCTKFRLEVYECECGYHIGFDATFFEQVGELVTLCPSCKKTIRSKQCGSCEEYFIGLECFCGSGNWVDGCIDEG